MISAAAALALAVTLLLLEAPGGALAQGAGAGRAGASSRGRSLLPLTSTDPFCWNAAPAPRSCISCGATRTRPCLSGMGSPSARMGAW
jgi:hypothetical protein